MAVLTNCCLSSFPPPTNPASISSSPASRTQELLRTPLQDHSSWKRQCVLGLTCAIIGLETGDLGFVGDIRAAAGDVESAVMVGSSGSIKLHRWSDRTACKPWRINSLETIVPENLPRPVARRRWEAIQFPASEAPPSVVLVPKSGAKSCFSL